MNLLWFIPTFGDGRYLGSVRGARETNYAYLRQIAEAVDSLGYYGALLPTGRTCDDSWIVAAALIPATQRMRFLVAVRPGLMTPTITARMVATFDQISNGRLLINVVAGGDPVELAGDGLHLKHDQRYELTGEFLHIFRRVLNGESVDFTGDYLHVQDAKLFRLGIQRTYPELWFRGSSSSGQQNSAQHVDVYLTWGEPPADVAAKIDSVRRAASSFGRSLRFGLRVHIIVRDTDKQAWEDAGNLLRHVSDESIAAAQKTFARFDSEGQKRMVQLHGGQRDRLQISPNLWAGGGLVRGGAGTPLDGDPGTVAARLQQDAALRIATFIPSGYPHREEVSGVAELLFPLLPVVRVPKPTGVCDVGRFGDLEPER